MNYADAHKKGAKEMANLFEEGLKRQAAWMLESEPTEKLKKLSVLVMWVTDMVTRGYGHLLPLATFPRSVHSEDQ